MVAIMYGSGKARNSRSSEIVAPPRMILPVFGRNQDPPASDIMIATIDHSGRKLVLPATDVQAAGQLVTLSTIIIIIVLPAL